MKRWTSKDIWTDQNDASRQSVLSDESLQIKRELIGLTRDALRMSMVDGDSAGLFLGIARMLPRGYRLATNREFIFLTNEGNHVARAPNRVLRAKLARWGWDNVPEGDGRDVWRNYCAHKGGRP